MIVRIEVRDETQCVAGEFMSMTDVRVKSTTPTAKSSPGQEKSFGIGPFRPGR